MSKVIFFALLALFCASYVEAKCGYLSLPGSAYISVSGLRNSKKDYETSEGTVQFRANICGELVGDYDCPAGTAFAAIAGDKCNPIGSLPFGDASLYAGTNDQSGIEIDMGIGAKTGACQNGFSGKIRVVCDPTATTATFARVESTNSCNYVAIINSKSGCAKKKTSSSSGLSGGWIFTILVLVGFFVYFVIGIIFKTQVKGASTVKEAIPNIDFWTELPGLVKDGSVFFYHKVRSCISGNKGGETGGAESYNQL